MIEFREILTMLCHLFDSTNIAVLVVKLENRWTLELEIIYVAPVQKISEHLFFFSVGPCMAKLCPFFDLALKHCQNDNLKTAIARILIFGIWLGINV